jgi:GxxExxY protein
MAQRSSSAADDPLTYRIIGCAIAVHRELGPGLLESAYDECMGRALAKAGLSYRRKPRIGVTYEGSALDREYRPDFLVDDQVVVELKSVAHFLPVHQAQVLTYMKLSRVQRGLLINFNVVLLVNGIKRLIMTEAPSGASA